MSTEKFNVIFPLYPETLRLSEEQREKLIPRGDKPLKVMKQKKLDAGEYIWKEKEVIRGGVKTTVEFLFDVVNDTFVVANPKVAGTPKEIIINSQLLWQSASGAPGWHHTIQKLKRELSEWFKPGLVRQFGHLTEPIQPKTPGTYIHFEYIFYYPFLATGNKSYQDYINHWYVRGKVFEDTMEFLGLIKNDSPDYVRGGYARYVNIPDENDRRLEVKIHFCRNNQRIE